MFRQAQEYLERSAHRPDVFFRDDDADRDLPELCRLLDLFGSRKVPLSLAVIPGSLTDDGARRLRNSAAEPWLELHQHGWMHVNHEREGRQCEFGPSRGFAEQLADIARGRQRLAHMLGHNVAPVFTPPWNRCTAETCRALDELGFAALSKDRSPRVGHIREVSVAVDIFTWKSGPRLKSPDEVGAELCRWMLHLEPVGILLHHKVMSAEAFAMVASLLDTLLPYARFQSLEAACEIRH